MTVKSPGSPPPPHIVRPYPSRQVPSTTDATLHDRKSVPQDSQMSHSGHFYFQAKLQRVVPKAGSSTSCFPGIPRSGCAKAPSSSPTKSPLSSSGTIYAIRANYLLRNSGSLQYLPSTSYSCCSVRLCFLVYLLTGKNEAVETERKVHNQSVEIYLFEDKLRRWHSIGHCVDFI